MNFYLKGHSGCSLNLIKNKGEFYVRKTSSDKNYNSRLKKQMSKQNYFSETNNLEFVATPQIHSCNYNSGLFYFDMKYYNYEDFGTYLSYAGRNIVDQVFQSIVSIIEQNLSNSNKKEFPVEILYDKYESVKFKIHRNSIVNINQIKGLIEKIDKIIYGKKYVNGLPIGMCHGDLTLSNILFNRFNNDLILIDFLDNFIETPLQDMVKLRQDLRYKWSFNMLDKEIDFVKVSTIFDYLDNNVIEFFSEFTFYKEYYQIFQIINFLRILPYVKENEILNYVLNCLKNIMEEN